MTLKTADDIESTLLLAIPSDDDEREYDYRDPDTQRRFNIRRTGDEGEYSFYLTEVVSIFRVGTFDKKGNCIGSDEIAALRELEEQGNPNGFMKAAKKLLGVRKAKNMIFTSGGYSTDSRYQNSLEECCQEIADCLNNNVRHNCRREISEEERAARAIRAHADSVRYWESLAKAADFAEQNSEGLFKGCFNMFGILDNDSKKTILGYINAPSQEKWLDIRSTCFFNGKTLWQAWCSYDEKAPRSGNVGFPSPAILKESIRDGVKSGVAEIQERLQELKDNAPVPKIVSITENSVQVADEEVVSKRRAGMRRVK